MYLKKVGLEDEPRVPIFKRDYWDKEVEFLNQETFFEKRYVVFSDYDYMGILDMKTMETKEFLIEEMFPDFKTAKKPQRQKLRFMVRDE